MGSDFQRGVGSPFRPYFNPRSPDGERLVEQVTPCGIYVDFNPRSPDGERLLGAQRGPGYDDFNPRSPDGERHTSGIATVNSSLISIHAPRMGSDFSRP